MSISKTIVETLFLFAVLLVSSSEAVRIEKIQTHKVNSTNTHPGEFLPLDDYPVCSGDVSIMANCGLGDFMGCTAGRVTIFQQSWNTNEMAVGGGYRTALTYLKCEWVGSYDSGSCESMSANATANFCYMVVADPDVSVSPTSSSTPSSSPTPTTPSSSRAPSSTPSSSRAPSQTPANSLTASVSASRTSPSRTPSLGTSLTSSLSNSVTRLATVSRMATFSRMASSTRAASISNSKDPFLACYSLVTPGYDRLVVKIADVPDVSVNVGGFWQINLDEYFCDPEQGAIYYTVEGNLPAGLIQQGAYLKGTAEAVGSFQITVYAWDANAHHAPSPGSTFWVNVPY